MPKSDRPSTSSAFWSASLILIMLLGPSASAQEKNPSGTEAQGSSEKPAAGRTNAQAGGERELEALAERLVDLRGEVESIHDDIQSMQRTHDSRMTSLSQRRAELAAQIQRQELELQKLRSSFVEIRKKAEAREEAAAALEPLVMDLIARLEDHVKTALPFKREERMGELKEIRRRMENDEISLSRAVNQLWTFVEDEIRLCKENGLFRQTIVLDGEEQLVDVVRLGMVMLFFEADDGTYGHAQRANEQWSFVTLEGDRKELAANLFDSFERQVRTGYFEIPNALGGGRP